MEDNDITTTGIVIGFTTPELVIVLATLEWKAAGEPGEDSEGRAVIEPLGVCGREVETFRRQLPSGWDSIDADGFLPNEVHQIFLSLDYPMSRWLQMLIEKVYDAEVRDTDADRFTPVI